MDGLLSVFKSIAPTVASAFGTPLAGYATDKLLDVLLPDTAEGLKSTPMDNRIKALTDRVKSLDPKDIEALKQLDVTLQVELAKLELQDVQGARQRAEDTNDSTPKVVTYVVIVLWLVVNCVVLWLVFGETEVTTVQTSIVSRVLGILDMAIATVLHFTFGTLQAGKR